MGSFYILQPHSTVATNITNYKSTNPEDFKINSTEVNIFQSDNKQPRQGNALNTTMFKIYDCTNPSNVVDITEFNVIPSSTNPSSNANIIFNNNRVYAKNLIIIEFNDGGNNADLVYLDFALKATKNISTQKIKLMEVGSFIPEVNLINDAKVKFLIKGSPIIVYSAIDEIYSYLRFSGEKKSILVFKNTLYSFDLVLKNKYNENMKNGNYEAIFSLEKI